MFAQKRIQILIILFLAFGTLQAQTLYSGVGHIPPSHRLEWHNAGLLKDCNSITPKQVFDVNDYIGHSDGMIAGVLAAARGHVSTTEGLAIVYFPEGTYAISDYIELQYPDRNPQGYITQQGAVHSTKYIWHKYCD